MANKYAPPTPDPEDYGHLITRVVLSPVPGATELFNSICMQPLERRRDEWREAVGSGLQDLEDRIGRVAGELSKDEAFVDTLLQASTAAMKTADLEKRKALRNAVLNSAMPHSPDTTRQGMFIRLVDNLTPLHLRVLSVIAAPQPYEGITRRNAEIVDRNLPELAEHEGMRDLILVQLENEGLLPSTTRGIVHFEGSSDSRLTEFGEEFLAFIAEP